MSERTEPTPGCPLCAAGMPHPSCISDIPAQGPNPETLRAMARVGGHDLKKESAYARLAGDISPVVPWAPELVAPGVGSRVAQFASVYIVRGWDRLRVLEEGTKRIPGKGWNEAASARPEQFADVSNIALVMGDTDLCDLDLDWTEARPYAVHLFGNHCAFGREGVSTADEPGHIFISVVGGGKGGDISKKLQLTNGGKGEAEVILECRYGSNYTLLPGCPGVVRKGGTEDAAPVRDRIVFYEGCDNRPRAFQEAREVELLLALTALCAVVERHWPQGGGHSNAIAMHLGGTLAEFEVPEQIATPLLTLVQKRGGDSEWMSNSRKASDAIAKRASGKSISGLHHLCEELLLDGAVEKQIRAWLQKVRPEGAGRVVAGPIVIDGFTTNKNGEPLPTIPNIYNALSRMGANLAVNTFKNCYENNGNKLDDVGLRALRIQAEEDYGLQVCRERWNDVVENLAHKNEYNPVQDYLEEIPEWDRTPRIEKWLIDFAGAPDNKYVRAVSRIVLVAAVKRILDPGCLFQELLILISAQGKKKSTALTVLVKNERWFTDSLKLSHEAQKFIEQTEGVWIAEVAELGGMKAADIETLKNTLSRRTDKARMAYGRLPREVPRQFVMIGTTNNENPLPRDMSGNRRYWPVQIRNFDLEGLERERENLWAEAKFYAEGKAGPDLASIRLPEEIWAVAAVEQDARQEVDPWGEKLEALLTVTMATGERKSREGKISHEALWRFLEMDASKQTPLARQRLEGVLKKLGFRMGERLTYHGLVQKCVVHGVVSKVRGQALPDIDIGRGGEESASPEDGTPPIEESPF